MNKKFFEMFKAALAIKKKFWRTNPSDPHGINTAVYVAIAEIESAILDVEKVLKKK